MTHGEYAAVAQDLKVVANTGAGRELRSESELDVYKSKKHAGNKIRKSFEP